MAVRHRSSCRATIPATGPGSRRPTTTNLKSNFSANVSNAGAQVLIGRGFHDKFVVVPDVVISGSANVTYSGLYLNRERLSLHNREFRATRLRDCARGVREPDRDCEGRRSMRSAAQSRRRSRTRVHCRRSADATAPPGPEARGAVRHRPRCAHRHSCNSCS